jgi:hypothetical protein
LAHPDGRRSAVTEEIALEQVVDEALEGTPPLEAELAEDPWAASAAEPEDDEDEGPDGGDEEDE